jgi:hypothetical protein
MRSSSTKRNSNRDYTQTGPSSREAAPQRGNSNRDYTANRTSFKRSSSTKRKL